MVKVYDPQVLSLLDEGRTMIAGMIRVDLGEGAFGFIGRNSPYTYGGITYQPVPSGILTISDVTLTTGTTSNDFTLELAESPDDNLTPDMILQIETMDYRERPIRYWHLHHHPDTGVELAEPIIRYSGYINEIQHQLDPDRGAVAVINCTSGELELSRTNGRLRTNEDQARRSPGDLFFTHTGTTGREKLNWGKNS